MKRIQREFIELRQKLKTFDTNALQAAFFGHSILTIFIGEIFLFLAIYRALEITEFEDDEDDVDAVENSDLRRLV